VILVQVTKSPTLLRLWRPQKEPQPHRLRQQLRQRWPKMQPRRRRPCRRLLRSHRQ